MTQKHLPPRAMGLFLLAIVAWPCLSSAVQGDVPHDKSTKGESPSFLNDLIPVLTKWRIGDGWWGAGDGSSSSLGFSRHLPPTTRHARGGRRIALADSEQSLLLLKASGAVPHEGSVRLPLRVNVMKKTTTAP